MFHSKVHAPCIGDTLHVDENQPSAALAFQHVTLTRAISMLSRLEIPQTARKTS